MSINTNDYANKLLDENEKLKRERDELITQLSVATERVGINFERAKAAEAEIARRDAAAGEPTGVVTGYAVNGCVVSSNKLSIGDRVYTAAQPPVLLQSDIDRIVPAIDPNGLDEAKHYIEHALYVDRERIRSELKELAAQPAKLPPKLSMDIDPELQGEFRVHEAIRRKGFNQALDAALKLGAQQQKVVELPNVYTWSNSEVVYLAALKQALDAAGVKWEVKK